MKDCIKNLLKENWVAEKVISSRDNLDEFIRFARNNKLLYYALLLIEKQSKGGNAVAGIIGKEKGLYREAVRTVAEVSEIFTKRGLRFFVMKTFLSYPYLDHDIDVVAVERRKIREYAAALKEAGYKPISRRSAIREPGKQFYVKGKKGNQGGFIRVHLHNSVSWNGIEFLDASGVYGRLRSIRAEGVMVNVPSVEDELLITSAHAIHENGYITAGELLHLRGLLSGIESLDTDYIIAMAKGYNWLAAFRRYFSYADSYYRYLTTKALLSDRLKERLQIADIDTKFELGRDLVYFMPAWPLVNVYSDKVVKDLLSLKLFKIPREILSFFVVTWVLRFRKAAGFKRRVFLG